jgi:uncharacterized integral membrane protein (TIGR00698 family)
MRYFTISKWTALIYGIVLCTGIATAAVFLSSFFPLGSVVTAIIAGILVGNFLKPGNIFDRGISFCEKHILSLAIVFMGVRLDFQILKDLGLKSILLVITAMVFTISVSLLLSKIFRFNRKIPLLLGIGSAVCGSSAIAATKQIIGADEKSVGLSVAIVNFLGTLGIFFVPLIAKIVMNFSDINSGIMIGNTLQAVGQVVAAGFSISDKTGQIATIIKMTRILMLLPLVLILFCIFSDKKASRDSNARKPGIPLFVTGFIFMMQIIFTGIIILLFYPGGSI